MWNKISQKLYTHTLARPLTYLPFLFDRRVTEEVLDEFKRRVRWASAATASLAVLIPCDSELSLFKPTQPDFLSHQNLLRLRPAQNRTNGKWTTMAETTHANISKGGESCDSPHRPAWEWCNPPNKAIGQPRGLEGESAAEFLQIYNLCRDPIYSLNLLPRH